MLPSSHLVPINDHVSGPCGDAESLAEAFSAFISAAGRLEDFYEELQQQVIRLQSELAQSNGALSESLRRNEQMRLSLQHILDALPCGVVVLDERERIKLLNPEAKRLLEIDSNDTKKISISEILGRDFCEGDEREICLPRASGKRWLAVRKRSFVEDTATNAATRTILIIRDTTSEKQLHAEREAARKMVALAELSTVLAHEIRNPLACLELISGLIADQYTGDPAWISHLRGGIRSLSATVNNVLSFHGPAMSRSIPLPFAPAIKNSVEFVRPIAGQKQIQLTFVDHVKDARILCDESALQQLVLNLVCNAIRHSEPGGSVKVVVGKSVKDVAGVVALEVSDEGCGIPDQNLGRIFEAGFSGTGKTPGLGLAICKKVVEQHGGIISVSSRLNHGTTFRAEFPCL